MAGIPGGFSRWLVFPDCSENPESREPLKIVLDLEGLNGLFGEVMKAIIRRALTLLGVLLVALALVDPALAARRTTGPRVVVEKANKVPIASP